MNISVRQGNLAKALSAVSRIATTRTGLPILANILMRADDNQLTLSSTNLEVAITYNTRVQINESGAITIPAKLLADFVSNLPNTTLSLSTEGSKIKVETDGYRSTMNTNPADDYPALPEPSGDKSFQIDAGTLKKAIARTAPIVSADVSRPVLTGVYLHTSEGDLYMAATDGYRLAQSRLMKSDEEISAIIPGTSLEIIRQLISDGDVEVRLDDEQISFIGEDITITSRLIDGKFLNYQQLIPKLDNYIIKVPRDDLIKTVKLTEPFARVSSNTIIVEVDVAAKILKVRSITSQLGENVSEIEIDIEKAGEQEFKVCLNLKFLEKALSLVDGDMATIGFNGDVLPVVVSGADADYRHVVMPVNVNR